MDSDPAEQALSTMAHNKDADPAKMNPHVVTTLRDTIDEVNKRSSSLVESGALAADSLAQDDNDLLLFRTMNSESSFKSRAFVCFMKLSNKIFSNPQPRDFSTAGMSTKTLFHMVQLFFAENDYSCIRVSQHLKAVHETNAISHVDIWAKDVTEVSCVLLSPEDAVDYAKHFTPGADKIAPYLFKIKLVARNVSASIPQITNTALLNVSEAHHSLMKNLQAEIHNASGGPVTIELFVPVYNHGQAEDTVHLCSGVEMCRARDLATDPLDQYFKHSPTARTLSASQVILPDNPECVPLQFNTSITKWANNHHQLVHHMYASAYEHYNDLSLASNTPTIEFDAIAIRLPHVQKDARFALLVDPAENGVYLPQIGDHCKISSEQFGFPKQTLPVESEVVEDLISNFVQLLSKARNESDTPVESFRDAARAYLANDISDDKINSLLSTPGENNEVWRTRVRNTLTNNAAEYLCLDALLDPALEEERTQLSARRHDIPFGPVGPQYQVFLVNKPISKASKTYTTDLDVVDVKIPMLEWNPNEKIDDFVDRALDKEMRISVRFHPTVQSKPLRAESFAINSLSYPPSSDKEISKAALGAYQYFLDFQADPSKSVNLLEVIPGIRSLLHHNAEESADEVSTPPDWVLDRGRDLNPDMIKAIESFSNLPNGVSFIAGVAGCGKSTLLRSITLAAQYGNVPKHSDPASIPQPKISVLYVVNNNEGVDNYADGLRNMYEAIGFGENSPQIIRLYSMESELSSMTSAHEPRLPDPFDHGSAAQEMDTLTDAFIAENVARKLAVDIHAISAKSRQKKRRLRSLSLHQAALSFFQKNKTEDWLGKLAELMDLIDSGHELTPDERSQLKAETRTLYQVFLQEFDGIVCATPVACSDSIFRRHFSPDLVMMDEAARMRELTTLICTAWFDPSAYIMIGDVHQLQPHVGFNEDFAIPFKTSLRKSILARAVEAGAVSTYLTTSYRLLGDLCSVPSETCYMGQLSPADDGPKRFTEQFKAWVEFVQSEVHPGHPRIKGRLLVELPGSREVRIGQSTANAMHVKWTMDVIKKIVKSPTLKSAQNTTNPPGILLLPLYRAQYVQYQLAIDTMRVQGDLSSGDVDRIRLHTLDSSQGDEDDIVIVDMTRTSGPGFCGDIHRACILLTRARLGQITLMNKGMWMSKKTAVAEGATVLKGIHRRHDNCVLSVPVCDRCETIGDHQSCNCTAETRVDKAEELCAIPDCAQPGHTAETCPKKTCSNCGTKGHEENECQETPVCPRCFDPSHIKFECTSLRKCGLCRSIDHTTNDCTSPRPFQGTCNGCGEKGHRREDCTQKPKSSGLTCHNCRQTGHRQIDCPEPPVCRRCQEPGHEKRDCPTRECFKCKQKGHNGNECTAPFCPRCKTTGHFSDRCPKPLVCTSCHKEGHTMETCKKGASSQPFMSVMSTAKHTEAVQKLRSLYDTTKALTLKDRLASYSGDASNQETTASDWTGQTNDAQPDALDVQAGTTDANAWGAQAGTNDANAWGSQEHDVSDMPDNIGQGW